RDHSRADSPALRVGSLPASTGYSRSDRRRCVLAGTSARFSAAERRHRVIAPRVLPGLGFPFLDQPPVALDDHEAPFADADGLSTSPRAIIAQAVLSLTPAISLANFFTDAVIASICAVL